MPFEPSCQFYCASFLLAYIVLLPLLLTTCLPSPPFHHLSLPLPPSPPQQPSRLLLVACRIQRFIPRRSTAESIALCFPGFQYYGTIIALLFVPSSAHTYGYYNRNIIVATLSRHS